MNAQSKTVASSGSPSNDELQARRTAAVARGVATAYPVFAHRAYGAELWDVEGKRYIDFAGGIGVLNVGHRHPRVVEAVQRQMEAFTHTAFQVVGYEQYVALCERLNALAPFKGGAKSILFSTGAECVENAIKIARAATKRVGVVAFAGAFHGRTTLTMGLTGKVTPYKQQFGVSPPGIYHVPFPVDGVASIDQSINALETLFRADLSPADTAAIILEPVQGEGGFYPAPTELMQKLRAICDKHGIMLIADEVQSGIARTGRLFAVEHTGVEPDLVTFAKSIGAGLPLSGVVGRAQVMDAVEPGGLGGTYAGNPVACAAALAVLDVLEEEKLLDRASKLGKAALTRLDAMAAKKRSVANVRGLGSMIAFDLVGPAGQPDATAAKNVVGKALKQGLILLTCGVNGNSIRLLYPLVIDEKLFNEGLDIIDSCID